MLALLVVLVVVAVVVVVLVSSVYDWTERERPTKWLIVHTIVTPQYIFIPKKFPREISQNFPRHLGLGLGVYYRFKVKYISIFVRSWAIVYAALVVVVVTGAED